MQDFIVIAGNALYMALILLFCASCAAGPQMPVEPFRCFDAFGKEVPCIEEMDCHEEPKGKEL
jgi:hypothetical protein